ncbi:MAG: DUF2721 domain-containing protein [Bradyrhizobium sp.]|jgi:hypothetical protein
MPLDSPSASQISHVISQSAGPAFLLGAVSGFISVLVGRLERILDRSRAVNALPDDTPVHRALKADLPRLQERARLINLAVSLAISSGIVTTLLIIVAFTSAFFELAHEKGVAVLFIIAVFLFAMALVQFLREIQISLRKSDHF